MKKLIIGFGIILGAVILTFCGMFLYLRSQMKDLHPLDSAKINDTTFVVKGKIGDLYLVGKGTCYVAFDAADNAKNVAAGLEAFSIDPASVKAVFLTHSDADHTAALPLFTNARVYISKKELAVLNGESPRHFLFMTHKNTLPVSDYCTLNDNDRVIVDRMRVTAVSTPGHTAGSMCYRVGTMLFTGDLCVLKNGAVEPMVRIFTEDRATDSLSILRIARLQGIDLLATAHTGLTRDLSAAFATWR
jgi:glyoxylase-like metal-dependent hydrolase (beta-lactamase superfamily II)